MLPSIRNHTAPRSGSRRPSSATGTTSAANDARPGSRARRRASVRTASVLAGLGLVARASADQTFPYTPTTILLPSDISTDVAYIFAPSDDGSDAVDFLSVNVSSTLRSSSLQPTKLTSSLPFLSGDAGNCTTFAPSLFYNGTIAVLAGDCTGSSSSSLWTYTPSSDGSNTEPQWTSHAITPSASWDNAQSGPYQLGGILSFSAQLSPVLSDPTLYLYGGMAPSSDTTSSNASTWQADATYSNRMLRLTPATSSSSSSSSSTYALTYATPPGGQQPVAEAGFTWTALPPSITNLTSTVTQQTTHVLLGGHTQHAFVNMSTAAVWSLPEETWSFVGIAPPSSSSSGSGGDDLASELALRQGQGKGVNSSGKRGVTSVDSRSGHTAVLSEDGTSVVVYGGWVGDVGTAAQPQLAVVRVGVGLSGWAWEVPTGAAQDITSATGVYGHGAVLLPGNVMMVYGGFEIPAASGGGSSGVKRRAGGGAGGMFYNITSGSWSDEYVSPLTGGTSSGGDGSGSGSSSSGGGDTGSGSGSSSGQTGNSGGSSGDSSRTRNIGLGVGLGVGVLLLFVLAGFGIRWFRRRQQRRAARDETLRGLAQGVNGSLPRGLGDDDEMAEHDHSVGMFPWNAAAAREWYTGGHDPYTQGRRSLGYETLRAGTKQGPSLYIPPPPSASSASGRPRGARGLYQPTTTSSYDFTPLTRNSNRIEPIYEADEDEDGDLGKNYPLSPDKEESADDDPFLTPTLNTPVGGLFPAASASGTPRGSNSPTIPPLHQTQDVADSGNPGGQEQDPDVQGWVSDVDTTATPAALVTSRTRQQQSATAAAAATPPRRTNSNANSTSGRTSPVRRGPSTRSAGRHSLVSSLSAPSAPSAPSSDDGRTGSNLSERSAFSFVRGQPGPSGPSGGSPEDRVLLSRLRTTIATTTSTAVAGGAAAAAAALPSSASDSGTSSNSGNSYHTARSANVNFTALQAEGPSLLMGGGNNNNSQLDDEDYDAPGSPSKTRRVRRSWLGSLRRVFSGGSSSPESGHSHGSRWDDNNGGGGGGSISPTREGLLWSAEGGTGADYDGRGYYGGTGGLLQRRGLGLGREAWMVGENNGEEGEDWDRDLERAAAQRTVQIMFTVPREPLRVVNAEVEREESVMIVDPEEEEEGEDQDREGEGHGEGGEGEGAEGRSLTPTPRQDRLEVPPHLHPEATRGDDTGSSRARDRLSTGTLDPGALGGVGESPSPSLRAVTPTLHTAEAVRMERPRTRVREMVESFESRSREGSPGGSPERGV